MPLHTPPPQVAKFTFCGEQATPQPPQLAASLLSEVSQPLLGLPSQSSQGPTQVTMHTPPWHDGLACPTEQRWPQPPQFRGSASVCPSHPLAAMPSQSTQPGSQAATWQMPAPQLGTAWGRLQAWPQAPQESTSLSVATSQP